MRSVVTSAVFICLTGFIDHSIAFAQNKLDWSILTAPSDLMIAAEPQKTPLQITLPTKLAQTTASIPSLPETTQSIATLPSTPIFDTLNDGWNVADNTNAARLIYAEEGKAMPVGFICKKGDGFAHFRTLQTTGFKAGKHVLVQLKSMNGTIRIDANVGNDNAHTIESEVPIRTSSLVFVLTPKKGEPTLKIGAVDEAIPAEKSDVKLLHFQSLCDQAIPDPKDE